jgi:hypothetical protein
MADDLEMVRIIYHGPPASHPVGGMATGTDYGNHADGDTFYVWNADQQAAPDAFVSAEEKAVKGNKSKGTAQPTPPTTQTPPAPETPQGKAAPESKQPPADKKPEEPEKPKAPSGPHKSL